MSGWPPFEELPAPLRARLVQLAADVLGDVPGLPGPLRPVAGFVPSRRVRLGGPVIESALATEAFRGAVAIQVRARRPELVGALEQADPDPDALALAWLVRPEDAAAGFTAALGAVDVPSADDAGAPALRAKVEQLERTLREAKVQHRERLEELRTENAALRRRLGEARTQLRTVQEEADEVRDAAARLADAAEHDVRTARAQVRRLRAQVADLEERTGAEDRDRRTARDRAAVRARLLLDTLADAADGLRRELALPPVEGLPADAVDAVHATEGASTSSAAGVLGPASPELLEHLLAMPRSRLLVDGYNVSRSAWATSPLEAQRIRLAGLVGALVARTGAETTLVFDAQHTTEPPPTQVPRGVKVVFSPYGVIADDVIVEYVEAEPRGRTVVVVTDDAELAARSRRAGARVVRAAALLGMFGH